MTRYLNTAALLLALGTLAAVTAADTRVAGTPEPPVAAPTPSERVIKVEIGFEPWPLEEEPPAAPAGPPAVVIPPPAEPTLPPPVASPAPAPMPTLPEVPPAPMLVPAGGPMVPTPGRPAPVTLQALEKMALSRLTHRPMAPVGGQIVQASATEAADTGTGFVDQIIHASAQTPADGGKPMPLMSPAQAESLARQYKVLNAVRLRYYHLLALQRLIAVREELATVTREAVTAIDAMTAAGRASKAELLQARIEAREQAAALQTAKAVHEAVWQRLAATVGDPTMPAGMVAGDVEQVAGLPTFEAAWAHVLEASPELHVARSQVGLRQAGLRQTLDGGKCGCEKSSDSMVVQALARIGSPFGSSDPQTKQAAWNDLAKWEAEVTRLEQSLRQRLSDAYARYTQAKNVADVYKSQNLPDAKEAYELTVLSYRQGQGSWPQVQIAQRNYFRMATEYVEAMAEQRRAELVVLGLLLDTPEESKR